MSAEKKKKFTIDEVGEEVCEQIKYAIDVLKMGRQSLVESNVGKDFDSKPPRSVIMHAVSRALTELDIGLDLAKFHRGLISLCLFFLEDEDVTLALKLKDELKDTDNT